MSKNKESSKNSVSFTRQVPKFLQKYSHMLVTNKKNYLNEQLGDDSPAYSNEEDVIADGATVINSKGDIVSIEGSQVDDANIVALENTKEVGLDTYLAPNDTANLKDSISEPDSTDKKIIFNKNAIQSKRKFNSSTENKSSSKQKKTSNLLSFDADE